MHEKYVVHYFLSLYIPRLFRGDQIWEERFVMVGYNYGNIFEYDIA
jgi:hypothetical protein